MVIHHFIINLWKWSLFWLYF